MLKLYRLILLPFLLISAFLQGQNSPAIIEKLKHELLTNPSEKRAAVIYSDLTWYFSTVSIDSALIYGKKAIQASTRLGDSTLIAQVFSDVGAVYFRKGDFENSKFNYLKSYTIRKKQNDLKGLAKINNNLANIYEKTQHYKAAMGAFLEALSYFESTDDQKMVHVIKGNIGLILLKIKHYDKALEYIGEVVNYQQSTNSTDELCVSCLNLGNVYLQLNDTVNALKMYERSVAACTATGNKKGLASGYNNIAAIKTEQKKSKEALALFAISAKQREELNTDLDKANFDLNLAKEFIVQKNYTKAKNLLLEVEKTYNNVKYNGNLQTNYKSLIDVFAHLNMPDSVNAYVKKLILINAQLVENSVQKQTAELETKYQTVKKEKLILQKEAEAKEQKTLLMRISALAFLIALLGIIFYRQQQTKRLQQAREFALKSEIAEIETQNLLQEQRIGISRDLHDNIGSHLTFIISSINNLIYKYKNTNDALVQHLQKIESFAVETIAELRDTVWAMDATDFHFDDLRTRLIGFIEKQKSLNPDFKIEFELDDKLKVRTLNSFAGITIYRIIQEFTNNTLKHAKATKLSIVITNNNGKLHIELKDNGVGFDMDTCNRGHGLYNMEKRCAELNAEINMKSEIGKGTTVEMNLEMDALN